MKRTTKVRNSIAGLLIAISLISVQGRAGEDLTPNQEFLALRNGKLAKAFQEQYKREEHKINATLGAFGGLVLVCIPFGKALCLLPALVFTSALQTANPPALSRMVESETKKMEEIMSEALKTHIGKQLVHEIKAVGIGDAEKPAKSILSVIFESDETSNLNQIISEGCKDRSYGGTLFSNCKNILARTLGDRSVTDSGTPSINGNEDSGKSNYLPAPDGTSPRETSEAKSGS